MPSFSERNNLKPKKMVQIDEIDRESRVSIWNIFYDRYQNELYCVDDFDQSLDHVYLDDDREGLFDAIWCDFLKKTIDIKPNSIHETLGVIKKEFFNKGTIRQPVSQN